MVKHAHARFLNPYGPGGSSSTPFSCDRPAGGMSSRWGPGGRLHHHASAAWWRAPQLPGLLLLALGVLLAWGGSMCVLAWALAPPAPQRPPLPEYMLAPVLVSYAYYEKDATQVGCGDVAACLVLSLALWPLTSPPPLFPSPTHLHTHTHV
jgi:hypothetical protein